MKPHFKQLGRLVKKARKKSGKTQSEVASKLGYTSAQFVSNVERGLCAFPLSKYPTLKDVVGIDLVKVGQIFLNQQKKELREAFRGRM